MSKKVTKTTKRVAPLLERTENVAAYAFLAAILVSQKDEKTALEILYHMADRFEEDEKLQKHIFPVLMQICEKHGLMMVSGPTKESEERH